MTLLKKLSRAIGIEAAPQLPSGLRVYAVGDVHGRLDLLDQLLSQIEDDYRQRPSDRAILIFLGDLVDRGPDSAAVVERLRTYSHPHFDIYFLMGNHEEALLRVLARQEGWLSRWLEFGGDACAASYGVPPASLGRADEDHGASLLSRRIPKSHIAFLHSFQDSVTVGDYLFVHAGIRPGVAIADQDGEDLRWIREPFLSDTKPYGLVVVHGHTVTEEPEDRGNRVGVDTGAFMSGRLTALVLEGSTRRFLITNGVRSSLFGQAAGANVT